MEGKSNNKAALVIAAVVLVIGAGAAVYALGMSQPNASDEASTRESTESTSSEPDTSNTTESDDDATVGSTVIVFTDDGFNPSDYTSKLGEAVTVRNDSNMDLEFSSDDHPTHTENPELNLSKLAPGESATFTPAEAKTYSFHDHINAQYNGTLTVEE